MIVVELKNTAAAPRGFHDAYGNCVVVQPQETRRVTILEGQLPIIRGQTAFIILNEEAKQDTREPIDVMRDRAEQAGIKVDKRWGESRLVAELEKADALHDTDSNAIQDTA